MVIAAIATPSLRVTAAVGGIPLAIATVLAVRVIIETRRRSLEEITGMELRVPA